MNTTRRMAAFVVLLITSAVAVSAATPQWPQFRGPNASDVAAVNKRGERVRATPTIVGDTLYVRSDGHLWGFREKLPGKP